jgi:hypothetical protein
MSMSVTSKKLLTDALNKQQEEKPFCAQGTWKFPAADLNIFYNTLEDKIKSVFLTLKCSDANLSFRCIRFVNNVTSDQLEDLARACEPAFRPQRERRS